jgi:hypothetical protein
MSQQNAFCNVFYEIHLFIAILFIFPLMFKTNMLHITLAPEIIQIIANR